ncbi:MAG: cytidine deaminase [candidate division KSB1 bacterium]|nr:cytidine deaminase [candidate division KSB1 bacterium]MDZ7347130.1 cytidine deaminase [candidate division KSB1 bacterium]
MEFNSLVEAALAAKAKALAPYSHFSVGAAVLTSSGRIYDGCNIESSSLGLTICAERLALFKALAAGERSFVAVAVAADSKQVCPPCGACRQVLWDFAPNATVLMISGDGTVKSLPVAELLPLAFDQGVINHDGE